jgi:hypothetical protein
MFYEQIQGIPTPKINVGSSSPARIVFNRTIPFIPSWDSSAGKGGIIQNRHPFMGHAKTEQSAAGESVILPAMLSLYSIK